MDNCYHNKICKVKQKHEDWILQLDDVHAVSIGYKKVGGVKTDDLAIVVHTTDKKPLHELEEYEIIPPILDGIPTDVVEMPEFKPLPIKFQATSETLPDNTKYRPVPGGAEIYTITSPVDGGICTLGMFARSTLPEDDPEELYLLTNEHCLPIENQEVRQPVSGNPEDLIAYATRTVNSQLIDGGIARMVDNTIADSLYIQDVGTPRGSYDITIDNLNELVIKRGRTTGTTIGFIEYVDVNVIAKQHQIVIGSEDTFAAPGDSGAVVLMQEGMHDHDVVGLLWGGALSYTILCPISAVQEELAIELVTSNV